MSIELFEATKEERLYASQQSSQIAAQTGCMAKYQAAFSDKGDELLESMKVIGSSKDKDAYTAELNKLLEQLKTDKACGAPLSGRTALSRFYFHHTTAEMPDMDYSICWNKENYNPAIALFYSLIDEVRQTY